VVKINYLTQYEKVVKIIDKNFCIYLQKFLYLIIKILNFFLFHLTQYNYKKFYIYNYFQFEKKFIDEDYKRFSLVCEKNDSAKEIFYKVSKKYSVYLSARAC
jgi:hypothetical protein